jgi:fucose permease
VEEYASLLRGIRRRKLEALGAAGVGAAILIPLIAFVSETFIVLVPITMAGWLFVFLPFWRRRYRRTAAAAPRWRLHPE